MRRVAPCLLALAMLFPAGAYAKTIHFGGEAVAVPAGWPVYRLAERPRMCVRLDRKAVYLGRPGAHQRCPASVLGRRRAIVVDPGARARAARARGRASRVSPAHLSAASGYTGLGFDACTAPSRRSMSAWASSPYRGSGASGIADLAAKFGSSYLEPDELWFANWNGRASAASDPYVPAGAWVGHRIHQYNGGHDEAYGGVTINIDNNYVEGATAGTGLSGEDPRGSFEAAGSPAPGQVQIVGWAFDPNAPGKPVSIRAYLGGKPSEGGASGYELGPVAGQERADLSTLYPRAGTAHGFDASFPVVGSGRQQVCVYALDIGPGSDKLLGCKAVGVPLPLSLLRTKTTGNAIRLRLGCTWPEGTQCPGQILVRAPIRQSFAVRPQGKRTVKTKLVRERIP